MQSDMRLSRRKALAGLAAGLVPVSGCGAVIGNKPPSFESEPARFGQRGLSETNYEVVTKGTRSNKREVSGDDWTRTVKTTSHLTTYTQEILMGGTRGRTTGLGRQEACMAAIFTAPLIELRGETFDPIEDVSLQELLTRLPMPLDVYVEKRFAETGENTGGERISALGENVYIEQFIGSAVIEQRSMQMYVYEARFEHDGDVIVATAAHPKHAGGSLQWMELRAQIVYSLFPTIRH